MSTISFDPGQYQQIRMVDRNGPPEAQNCPFLLCAWCGEPVYAVKSRRYGMDGYVLWFANDSEDDSRQQLGPYIVHRLTCMLTLEAAVEQVMGKEWMCLSQEIPSFLRQLTHNATHPLGECAHDPEYPHHAEYIAPLPSTWRSGHYESASGS